MLTEFVTAERMGFEGPWVNLFAFSVGHATVFAQYLDIITDRYRKANAEYRRQNQAYLDAMKAINAVNAVDGVIPDSLGEPFMAALDGLLDRATGLHLEIESFYLFANIFLDRLAMNVEYIFGQARSLPLGSHHKLIEHIIGFAQDRGLSPVPAELIDRARALRKRITDYRDDEIAHARNPRTMKRTEVSLDNGGSRIAKGRLYPSPREQLEYTQSVSETPEELGTELDAYVMVLIAYLRANLSRARGRPAG